MPYVNARPIAPPDDDPDDRRARVAAADAGTDSSCQPEREQHRDKRHWDTPCLRRKQ
ncbi:MAG: hypothetical protein QOG75_3759, partial [Mycobacterium sp.]|nr:hypothetical protein [Mycobacterium sp.]